MRKTLTAIALAVTIGAGATLGGAGLASAATSRAAGPASHRITEDNPRWDCRTMGNHVCGAARWKAQTCTAFTAYQAHPTAGRLATLVTDSVHLGRSYLKADVGQLYADAGSPGKRAAKYVAEDLGYIAEDCAS